MRTLRYSSICPFSRQARIYLEEAGLEFSLLRENYTSSVKDFNFATSSLPILEEAHGLKISSIYPILEYLSDKYPNFFLMPENIDDRTEVRRLTSLFNDRFFAESLKILIREKFAGPILFSSSPRTDFLKIAKNNFRIHMDYASELLKTRHFLSSENIACCDIVLATHLSIFDYFGEVNWEEWPYLRNFYSIIKSRPSFRGILTDRVPGFSPSKTYEPLDF